MVQSKITEIFFQLTLVAGGGNDPTVQNLAILILSWENVTWLIAMIDEHLKEKHISVAETSIKSLRNFILKTCRFLLIHGFCQNWFIARKSFDVFYAGLKRFSFYPNFNPFMVYPEGKQVIFEEQTIH